MRSDVVERVSVLFSEPKIPQFSASKSPTNAGVVSVLFSEPKIPQSSLTLLGVEATSTGFSALQRAENSSMLRQLVRLNAEVLFQCSSASRKFLNVSPTAPPSRSAAVSVLFSEPKIPQSERRSDCDGRPRAFQCSSASRKFLNDARTPERTDRYAFQCSSASRKFLNRLKRWSRRRSGFVSVLFSEPKIPQSEAGRSPRRASASFSALQRAENSSIALLAIEELESATVSVLFSEPKIPQYCANCCRVRRRLVSVLFSEPKIPQSRSGCASHTAI